MAAIKSYVDKKNNLFYIVFKLDKKNCKETLCHI